MTDRHIVNVTAKQEREEDESEDGESRLCRNPAEKLSSKYGKSCPAASIGRPLQSLKPSCLLERHFPDFIPATKQKPRKLYCLLQERPKERVNMHVPCHDCNARLCPVPSFHTYHTEAEY
jgi:hypothetical protein